MKGLRRLWVVIAAGALLVAPAAVGGCSGTGSAKTASVQPGDMPEGGEWRGVYFSQLYGYLHIETEGDKVHGKWLRPHKDKWGELHGTITGDLVRFQWTEYTVGAVGPNSSRTGKGYLKYTRPEGNNVDDTIAGELGRDKDETGEPWDAVKQRNVQPDLASIGGTGAGDIGGGDWDSENKEQGTPEAPAPPP
jgi:hypothetical protein